MPNSSLDGLRVAILVADDFEELELTEPRKALDAAGRARPLVRDGNWVTSRQPSAEHAAARSR